MAVANGIRVTIIQSSLLANLARWVLAQPWSAYSTLSVIYISALSRRGPRLKSDLSV